ncbi:hypothetical protein EMIHUDRAFT_434394 [Emiliania huxleyi CCMP1516]|uniref:APOBEC-like N-terminal domain-containing protein n=2 Tax=Emiliania huxleyi TaxID=2903 RepID=A0A0D3K5S6_EMIH1|nr:hypothetical protein EMIHUDRAFT_434394 [Emiliania huxleyi CCMP1516]EOD31111.1 hypothetical protein EMIHUDRAFT_434394 [Emiliania huxleyi CCMP1516]|eukprot:XP_005783540.1 hypothetical protein EMIHUDRAFT_434394 [Emiliania huxleyi CCMP1516]
MVSVVLDGAEATSAYVPPHRRNRRAAAASKSRPALRVAAGNPPGWLSACACGRAGAQMSIYPSADGHTVVPESGRSLLGTTAQFCSSFYHIEPTPEGDIPERCLSVAAGGPPCPRKTVICVARLQTQPRRSGQDQAVAAPSATDTSAVHGLAASTATLSLSGAARQTAACTAAAASSADASAPAAADARWSDLYIARYSNCWRGSSESNVHAEQFLLQDEDLRSAIAALASAATPGTIGGDGGDSGGDGGGGGRRHRHRLLLYLTYQPCHHSGGHSRRLLGEHSTSCTSLLCAFVREVLALLRREGVALQSLSPADWAWLVSHCDAPTRDAWARGAPPFGAAVAGERSRLDAFVSTALVRYGGDEDETGAMPLSCEPCAGGPLSTTRD